MRGENTFFTPRSCTSLPIIFHDGLHFFSHCTADSADVPVRIFRAIKLPNFFLYMQVLIGAGDVQNLGSATDLLNGVLPFHLVSPRLGLQSISV